MNHNEFEQITFYFDTSIWLDLFEKRGKNGFFAYELVKKVLAEDLVVCYSDLVIIELKRSGYAKNEISGVFYFVKPCKIERIHIFAHQKEEAKNVAKQRSVPAGDVLHAILCRDNNLQLISRDLDFEALKDITIVKKPEDFI